MIARLVLGYVLGVLAFIPHLTKAVGKEHSYKLAILMTSEVPGTLQVFYDTGAGLREADSVAVPLETGRREYELPLPQGLPLAANRSREPSWTLHDRTRSHPGTRRVDLLADSTGGVAPRQPASLIERTSERLVVDSPPGSNDPQLLYVPPCRSRCPYPRRAWACSSLACSVTSSPRFC